MKSFQHYAGLVNEASCLCLKLLTKPKGCDQHQEHVAKVTALQEVCNTCSCLLGRTLLIHAALIMLPCTTLSLFLLQYDQISQQDVTQCVQI